MEDMIKIHIKHCVQYLHDDPINVRTIMITIYIIIITMLTWNICPWYFTDKFT